MHFSISELSDQAKVSARTLRYYDEIGLLKPAKVQENGYRIYDEKSLQTLEVILYYRELDFSLKEILEIVKKPKLDLKEILAKQYHLLELRRNRLNRLLKQLDNSIKGGIMSLEEFDMSEIEEAKSAYSAEVEKRWGNTEAYKESARKSSQYDKDDWAHIRAEQDTIYRGFAKLAEENANPAGIEAQALVAEWQAFISKYFYECSDEILGGLGKMYVCDTRFQSNIDTYGEGTAAFQSAAIEAYVS